MKEVNKIIQGDCLVVLKTLPENFIDSIVCDPPYELGFMGKSWDNTGIANDKNMWAECLRVLKPGGHLLAFSGTRTYHRMASAIEDAGFEVRDMIEWVYGSGFPKSLNIGKAVDKLQGNEREELGDMKPAGFKTAASGYTDTKAWSGKVSKGTSEWEGWGTALKPAHEPICMARKPLAEKTVAENCLKYGTGGINIDESRVESNEKIEQGREGRGVANSTSYHDGLKPTERSYQNARFPANLLHDNSEEVRECFPESNSGKGKASTYEKFGGQWGKGKQIRNEDYGDSGNASRFFKSILYYPKASKSERNKGCEGLEEKEGIRTNAPRENEVVKTPTRANNHPTVKPIALMEYLIKMVTPKGGIVLDPFAGSGSTLVAAKENCYQYIGIEKEKDYIKIAEARITSLPNRLCI